MEEVRLTPLTRGNAERSVAKISRRAFVAGMALLAAGCGPFRPVPSPLSQTEATPLTWYTWTFAGLLDLDDPFGSPREKLAKIVAALEEDTENPNGPARAGYTLTPRLIGRGDYPDPPPRNQDEFADWIGGIETDLLSIGPTMAHTLGDRGVLLPLDRLIAADGPSLTEAFYPYILKQFRAHGSLYALPIDADPQMLFYEPAYFEAQGVPPPNETWDWDDLVENALKLTQRGADGTVTRWGLMPHMFGFWWALWQNEAEAFDSITLRCRLREPAATEALQFCRDLLHIHRVAPLLASSDVFDVFSMPPDSMPAMFYRRLSIGPSFNNRWAELPRGKVHSVPVSASMGLAIHAQAKNTDAAYAALKGIVATMQRFVPAPAQQEAVARLGDFKPSLSPEQVKAVQRSMEHGRPLQYDRRLWATMNAIVDSLVQGDEVATAVNKACSALEG